MDYETMLINFTSGFVMFEEQASDHYDDGAGSHASIALSLLYNYIWEK